MNTFIKTIFYKFTSILVVIGILGGMMLPSRASAVLGVGDVVTDPGNQIANSSTSISTAATSVVTFKTFIADLGKAVLSSIAKRALAKMTEATVNWINSGYEGSPLYISDPDSFFRDIAHTQIQGFVDDIGYDVRTFPFGKQFALNFIQSYKRKFAQNAAYSMNKVLSDQTNVNFKTNFAVGGWDGWLALTQIPQNNPIGFSYLASQQINAEISGTIQTPAEKVKVALEQGSGFLSPQRCAEPAGIPIKPVGSYEPSEQEINDAYQIPYDHAYAQWIADGASPADAAYEADKEASANLDAFWAHGRAQWQSENVCRRIETTTPGHIVADQITNALGSKTRQTELAQALGNSLSAIFDALLNDLANRGLSSLSTVIAGNPSGSTNPNGSQWTYNGLSLDDSGSANTTNGSSNWSTGADVVLDVGKILGEVDTAIANSQKQLATFDQESAILNGLATKNALLDECLPGPDLYWQFRVEKQLSSAIGSLQNKAADKDNDTSSDAEAGLEDLTYAEKTFIEYITTKMVEEIPSAITSIDHLNRLKTYMGDLDDIKHKKRLDLVLTLARLNSIKTAVQALPHVSANSPVRPTPLTDAQKTILFTNYQKYNAMIAEIPRDGDLDSESLKLSDYQAYDTDTTNLTQQCQNEKAAKGWISIPYILTQFSNIVAHLNQQGSGGVTDKELFCDIPVEGGYSYGKLERGSGSPTVDIPIVNAYKIAIQGSGDVHPKVDCDRVFYARSYDYTNPNPGANN